MASHRAQLLEGDHCVFDVGRHASSQQQRQLDALPISTYRWDSALPHGSRRLIAVNCKYICYCLRSSNSVRILGRNVASRGLFHGHSQRVTDIEFFAENVHLLASVSSDGRLFVWRIVEDAGANSEFQLQQYIIFAVQFEGSWNSVQPRVCWHPQSQECLLMCISDLVLKIDVNEARKKASHFKFSAEALLSCPTANLIDGISCIGHHDADVTDLSVFLRDCLYVASASRDGTVRIWGSGQSSPLAVLMPHEGQPVGCVIFLTSLTQPDEAVLLTSDTANKKLKLWVPSTSRTCCVWYSVQTLEFMNCDGNSAEQVLLNQICSVPQAGLVLLGRSENPAIYSVHLKFGNASSAVRMHYLAEFFISMPILSFTAVTETGSSCKDIAHVFCVQTRAIQEYFLNISYSLSSQCNKSGLVSSSAALLGAAFMKMSVHDAVEAKEDNKRPKLEAKEVTESTARNPGLTCEHSLVANPGSGFGSWVEVPSWIAASVKTNLKGGSMEAIDFKEKNLAYHLSPLASGLGVEVIQSHVEEYSYVSKTAGDVSTKPSFVPKPSILSSDSNNSKKAEDVVLPVGLVTLTCGPCHIDSNSLKQDSTLTVPSAFISRQPCGISSVVDKKQSEIMRQEEANISLQGASAVSDTEVMTDVCGVETIIDLRRVDSFDVTAVGVDQFELPTEIGSEHYEPGVCTVDSTVRVEERKHDAFVVKESVQISSECQEPEKDEGLDTPNLQEASKSSKKKRNRRKIKASNRVNKSTAAMSVLNLAAEKMSLLCRTHEDAMPAMVEIVVEDKPYIMQRTIPPPINSLEDLSVQISAMQESLDQLLTSQTEIQENLYSVADIPLSTEIEPPGASLQECRNNEFGICLDSFWRQLEEKLRDRDMLQQEWAHQLWKAFNDVLAKVNTTASAPMLMAEMLQSIGSNMGPLISSCVDNVLATILPQNLEGCNKKVMKFVEKSFEGSLNISAREQLESIWVTFWKHLMQEELKSYICQQAVLKVEQSCTNVIEHGHYSLYEDIIQSFGPVEQQSNSTGLALISSLKDTLLSVSSIVSSLKEDLQDAEKNDWNFTEHSNARYSFDKELTQLLQQGQLEDAFTLALSLGNSFVTSWICKQVDLRTLFQSSTPPFSQGVVLSLVEQLALDLGRDSGDKLAWMEYACLALHPGSHPELCIQMQVTLSGVLLLLQQQINLFTGDVKLANQARLVMHLVNSLRTLCA